MTRRHYGIPLRTNLRPTYTGQAPAGALSGSAFIGAIVVILIVLGVVLYGVSQIVTDAANTVTSAPQTTGAGSQAPKGPPSGTGR
jgi:hypothetical protein